eukprot:jgi/Hompol1/1320/HPOL_003954-RA
MKKVQQQPQASNRSVTKTLVPNKDKRPPSGAAARAADQRAGGKGKSGKGGKNREGDDNNDGGLEGDGQKDGEVSLAWLYLTAEQIEELDNCEPEDELIFAKQNRFTPLQISVFFSIMKITLDKSLEKTLSHLQTLADFRKLLFDHMASPSSNAPGQSSNNLVMESTSEVFGPGECKLIVDYALSTLFQFVFTVEQERQDITCPVVLETPVAPLPLSDSITLETYEMEQRAREQAQRELIDMEGLANAVDIVDSIPPEELKAVTLETITALLESLSTDFDKMLSDQRQRFLNQISKLSKAE